MISWKMSNTQHLTRHSQIRVKRMFPSPNETRDELFLVSLHISKHWNVVLSAAFIECDNGPIQSIVQGDQGMNHCCCAVRAPKILFRNATQRAS